MKNTLIFSIIALCVLSCTTNTQKQNDSVVADLNKKIEELSADNKKLKDTVELLKYPVVDRLKQIKEYISKDKLADATRDINQLKNLFPLSEEAKLCVDLEKVIADKREKIVAEEARKKALGFKALSETPVVEVFYNKISVGAFSTSQTFIFDSYDERYFYKTADRGNKFISARITITSKKKDPKLPVFYAYRVVGGKLEYEGSFMLRFARWEDYSTYLGNYNDNSNDFSKTATIPFKIGLEVSNKVAEGPLVILCKRQNCMVREYDRFANPPASYSIGDDCTYDATLTIDDLKKGYLVVKVLNKNKL